MTRVWMAAVGLAAVVCAGPVRAETPPIAPPTAAGGIINGMDCPALAEGPTAVASAPPQAPTAAPRADQVRIPAALAVNIALAEPVSSARFHRGDCFQIVLVDPIVIDGRTVASPGARGVGQVVDARRGGIGGTPGMIMLAARYLRVGETALPLRGFRIGGGGQDHTASLVTAGAVASALVPMGGMFIIFIPGGDMVYQAGFRAEAHVRSPVDLPVASEPAPPLQSPSPTEAPPSPSVTAPIAAAAPGDAAPSTNPTPRDPPE